MKIPTDKLFCLCNKYEWFMNCDYEHYDMLFDCSRRGVSLKSLATIISLCSSGWTERAVLKILKQEAALLK